MALSPSLDGYTIEIWDYLPCGKTVFHRTGQITIQMKGEAVQMVLFSAGVRTHTLIEFDCVCEHVCVWDCLCTRTRYHVTDYNIHSEGFVFSSV